MKKIATSNNNDVDPNAELANAFWRWFSFSVFALLLAAAIPAFSADVFIDEGDGDFAATPVSTPPAPVAPNVAGKAPASTDEVPPGGPGGDIDSAISELEPSPGAALPPSASTDMSSDMGAGVSNEKKVNDLMAAPPKAKKAAMKSKTASKKTAKVSKKSSKKVAKKADKKKATASKSKKKSKKTADFAVTFKTKKKPSKIAANKTSSKRKVASISKFAGGKYATAARSCALESAPGAGDSSGMTKASRKLWVEESGNTSYYKVFVKGGTAAYVAKDCF